ncbi:hypothetical protein BDR22DRAFT_962090 [Usnea florida]
MSNHPPQIHTYHCHCSTLLLATPYPISHLPQRAPPSLDRAHILPLPPLSTRPQPTPTTDLDTNHETAPVHSQHMNGDQGQRDRNDGDEGGGTLPSLLTANLRPARKVVVVRREDGFEKRRVYRCGRCGVVVGYEVLREGEGEGRGREGEGRVMYMMEGGLVETGEMGKEDGV